MIVPEPEFEQFFVANYEPLVRSLTAVTGNRETARDCVQDAFVKASTRWRRIRRYDNPATWVRRVAINRSRDLHRAERRRVQRERRFGSPTVIQIDDGPELVDGSLRLAELLAELPERQRTVAALFYAEDISVSEIAEVLGISEGAVKFHLNRARGALRGALEEQEKRYG